MNKFIFFLTFYLILSGCINESKTDGEFKKKIDEYQELEHSGSMI